MPTFTFRNTDTGEEFEDLITNARREELLEKNPHIKQMPTMFSMASAVGDRIKNDAGWNEVLSKAAESYPASELGQRYGKQSTKQIKTNAVMEKHRAKWRSN